MPSITIPGLASDGVASPSSASPTPSNSGYPDRGPTQYEPGPGQISLDYSGSYDEWRQRVVSDLVRRFVLGLGGKGSDDPSLGNPSPEDFGSGANGQTGQYSFATLQYWERFVDKYGATDPFVQENYGPPPDRRATYVADPNSAAAVQDRTIQDNKDQRTWQSGENAADRRHDMDVVNAQIKAQQDRDAANNAWQSGENALDRTFQAGQSQADRDLAWRQTQESTNQIRMQIESNERLAAIDDATRRYLAEGDWGVQKWITEQQEKGALDRLTLELGMRDKELAQAATGEANRHHETMVGLIMQVAQYDSELAAQPVNWLKYAAWLKNRGQIVDGLTLSMAAEQVPEQAISPQDVATSGLPGASVAAAQTFEQQMQSGQPAIQTQAAPSENPAAANAQNMAGTGSTAQSAAQPDSAYSYNGIDLNNRNYGQLLDQILGLNPNAPVNGVDNSKENVQATLDSLNTTGANAQQNVAGGQGFQLNGDQFAFNGAGSQQDYRKFAALKPAQQQMNVAAAQAAGSDVNDYLYDMKKAKPKGGVLSGAGGYG